MAKKPNADTRWVLARLNPSNPDYDRAMAERVNARISECVDAGYQRDAVVQTVARELDSYVDQLNGEIRRGLYDYADKDGDMVRKGYLDKVDVAAVSGSLVESRLGPVQSPSKKRWSLRPKDREESAPSTGNVVWSDAGWAIEDPLPDEPSVFIRAEGWSGGFSVTLEPDGDVLMAASTDNPNKAVPPEILDRAMACIRRKPCCKAQSKKPRAKPSKKKGAKRWL